MFHQPALFKHDDRIVVYNRTNAMGDREHCRISKFSPHHSLDAFVCFHINRSLRHGTVDNSMIIEF